MSSKNPRKIKQKLAKKANAEPTGSVDVLPSTSSNQSVSSASGLRLSSSTGQRSSETFIDTSEFKYPAKKTGSNGTSCDLFVNFFELKISKDQVIYQYNINILDILLETKNSNQNKTPRSKKVPKRINQIIFDALFKDKTNQNIFGNILPVFDGEKNLYSFTPFNLNGQWTSLIKIKDGDEEKEFKIEIIETESSSLRLKSLETTNLLMPAELQCLDIIMKNVLRLDKIQSGFSFFPKFKHSEQNRFEIDDMKYGTFGAYQSARLAEKGRIFYNVDQSIAVFNYGGKLLENIKTKILKTNEINPSILFEKLSKNKIEKNLKDAKFKLLHLSYERIYKFNSLTNKTISEISFKIERNGKTIETTVFKYFQETYREFCERYKLNRDFPCVQVGSNRDPKYFPIECCYLLEDEVFRGNLDQYQQSKTTRESSKLPSERFDNIKKHVAELKTSSTPGINNFIEKFGVQISKDPTKIKGRILDAPLLQYGNKELDTEKSGMWKMVDLKYLEPSKIGKNWALINFRSDKVKMKHIRDLIKKLIDESKKNGVDLTTPPDENVIYEFQYNGKGSLNKDLFEKFINEGIKLLIIVIPSRDAQIYNEIKSISELNHGMITQCLSQDQKYWDSYGRFYLSPQLISNIFLKINPKTGGVNHTLGSTKAPFLEKNIMIMGLDVTHPTVLGEKFRKSVAACVGTYDKNYDKCYIKLAVQEKDGKEIVEMGPIAKFLLDKYKSENQNKCPDHIIVYRDGVSEGQFQKVKEYEISAIKKVIKEYGENDIKITFICVQKRHNTRFLPEKKKYLNFAIGQNVKPGTVVDTVITHRQFWEFYLCSHAGAMGTSRPTKYVVIYDENDFEADDLQKITYQLCYLFPRCSKSLSIVPHTQYAHLLAKRGKAYLSYMEEAKDDKILSKSETNALNEKITVDSRINGSLFFI